MAEWVAVRAREADWWWVERVWSVDRASLVWVAGSR